MTGPLRPTEEAAPGIRLVRPLGRGGFGEVHLAKIATRAGLEQVVAVKLLRDGIAPRSQALERLRDEAMMLTHLRHPVIPVVHDLIEVDGRVAMVAEYVEGQDLSECIEARDGLPVEAVLDCVGQVASALDAVWSAARVIHRDIKPENIRIGVHGNVKLLDFGIARSDRLRREADTESRVLMGSARYLAPERFDAARAVTPAADVFGLGCVLYEGVTRAQLFDALELTEICGLAVDAAALERFLAGRLAQVADVDVRELLRGMLAPDPAERPSAAEVSRACEALCAARPGAVTVRRWCRDRVWPTEARLDLDLRPSSASGPDSAGRSGPRPTVARRTSPTLSLSSAAHLPARRLAAVGLLMTLGGVPVAGLAALGLLAILAAGATWWWTAGPATPTPREPSVADVLPPPPVPAPPGSAAEPEPEVGDEDEPQPAPETSGPTAPPPPAPTASVTFASVPAGAEVFLVQTGAHLGTTPLRVALPVGDHTVRMITGEGEHADRDVRVGEDGPQRHVWRVSENTWEAAP